MQKDVYNRCVTCGRNMWRPSDLTVHGIDGGTCVDATHLHYQQAALDFLPRRLAEGGYADTHVKPWHIFAYSQGENLTAHKEGDYKNAFAKWESRTRSEMEMRNWKNRLKGSWTIQLNRDAGQHIRSRPEDRDDADHLLATTGRIPPE